jgi:hypothetical protein
MTLFNTDRKRADELTVQTSSLTSGQELRW